MAADRLPLAGLEPRLQLVLLRGLGVAVLGLGFVLGIGGVEDVLAVARGAAAGVALLIGLAALAGFAALDDVMGLDQRPRGPIAAWSLLALILATAAGVAGLLALDFTDRLVWPLSGGVALGLAVAARVAVAMAERATSHAAADPPDAYLAYVRRRRTAARQDSLAGPPRARQDTLATVHSDVVAIALVIGLAGLGGLMLFRLAVELTASAAILLPLLIVVVPATIVALFFAAILGTLPLGLFLPPARAGMAHQGLARASGIQPLPDVLASAAVSAVTVLGARRQRAPSDR